MANMGYCRMENTLSDLRDVLNHWNDTKSKSEFDARNDILELCKEIVADYGEDEPEEYQDDEDSEE